MAAIPASVRFVGVSRRFGTQVALDRIDLECPTGKITALVGASGSGKSTLLQHINGLYRPDAGSVEVFGAPLCYERVLQLRRRIGYAVQGVALFPHLSAADNATLLARLEGWERERIETRLGWLMTMLGLDPTQGARFPHELSGGQQQRFGLCRALMLEPPLLLLDEPFSGLDPLTRHAIYGEFERLQASEPVTVVLVTHDLREARRLASHLVVLRDGRILQQGTPAQVLDAPAEDYVAQLVQAQFG